jgi:O-antigen/teichoic acid export membrane protein
MAMASKILNNSILRSMLRKNIVANYFGSVAYILGPLISLPFYLTFLGPTQYGLISFVLLIQILLNLLDAGLGQALVREVSVSLAFPDGRRQISRMIFNLERLYWGFALVVGLILGLMSTFISAHWLNLGDLPIGLGVLSVTGSALIFSFQFPGVLYRSFLIGSEAQVSLNKILIVANIFRHVGGVILVYLYPSIFTYLAWQALIALSETLARRVKVWTSLGSPNHQDSWNLTDFSYYIRLIRGLTVAIWVGALCVHLDKVILSKMISIEEFGYYTIASSISIGVLQLIYPVLQAVQPKAIALKDDPVLIRQLYMKLFLFIILVFSVVIFGFVLIGQSVIDIWLRHADAAQKVYQYTSLLLIGTAFNALYSVGYMDWIVRRKAKNILVLNLFSLMLMIIILPLAIRAYGVKGAALGWVFINMIGFCISLKWISHRNI